MSTLEARIAADKARYHEFLAAAAAGDMYAKTNADAYAARLKRMGALLTNETAPIASAPPPAPKPKPQPALSREDGIKRLAAAHDVPAGMLAAALADGTPAADFGLAVADYVAEQAREAEIDALVRRILES